MEPGKVGVVKFAKKIVAAELRMFAAEAEKVLVAKVDVVPKKGLAAVVGKVVSDSESQWKVEKEMTSWKVSTEPKRISVELVKVSFELRASELRKFVAKQEKGAADPKNRKLPKT